MKIHDCFMFFNELDLLELRFEYYNDVVDFFVFNESHLTHSGKEKPLYFQEHSARFKPYFSKIIYDVCDFPASGSSPEESMSRDWFQRAFLTDMLSATDDDIIIVSDLDEFWRREVIKNFTSFHEGVVGFIQKIYYFYLNRLDTSRKWFGPGLCFEAFRRYHKLSLNSVRNVVRSVQSLNGVIEDGGWHFTWLGGADAVKNKLDSFAHQEYNTPEWNGIDRIKDIINSGTKDLFRDVTHLVVPIDASFPEPIYKNVEKYKQLGWVA